MTSEEFESLKKYVWVNPDYGIDNDEYGTKKRYREKNRKKVAKQALEAYYRKKGVQVTDGYEHA